MRYDVARLAGPSDAPARRGRASFDGPFFVLSMLLLAAGVVMVLSASYPRAWYDPGNVTGGNAAYYFVRQLIFALLGVAAMLLASRVPMALYRRCAFPFLIVTLRLLMLVPLIGVKANGSRRWLGVGGLTLQPSELAKLAVILSFSALICRSRGNMRSFRHGILPFAGILAAIIGLLVLEPHFSASVIILAIGAVMLFLGGVRIFWFAGAFGAAGAAIAVLLTFFPYASSRINSWRDPFSDSSDQGYQWLRRPERSRPRRQPPEIPVPAGGAQRFYLLRRVRGAGLYRRGADPLPLRTADPARLVDRLPLPRALQLPGRRRGDQPACHPGFSERGGGDQSRPLHRHLAAHVQLRRNGPAHPAL